MYTKLTQSTISAPFYVLKRFEEGSIHNGYEIVYTPFDTDENGVVTSGYETQEDFFSSEFYTESDVLAFCDKKNKEWIA